MVKIAASAADRFVKRPPPEIRAILCYGPDSGLARERLSALALGVAPALDDPFLVCELSAETVRSDPARLADEAASIAMTGGRRVVILRGATDGIAAPVLSFLENPLGDALVLLAAGDLAAKSKMRKAFETSPVAAALPCYLDDAGGLDRLIDEGLRPLSVRIDREARLFLVDHLGSDRGISRSEIEKLALYAGPGGNIDIETIMVLIGDSSVSTLDGAVHAMADGKPGGLDRALDLAAEEGVAPVTLLRAAGSHMLRIRRVQDLVAAGTPMAGAVQSLRPPVFFKARNHLEAGVKRWSPTAAGTALSLILDAEAACKRSGAPAWMLCHRTLHQVGALARRQGHGRR